LFGAKLIRNKHVKVMKMTQKTTKHPKYDDNILEGMKSTETKEVLKANARQTRYGKTKPDFRT
jgi:hypothetical protein